ncbi:TerC family protein [Rosenbergiella australiborealis]|uniref:TerC family protein n=1 Tax=Rosenbergiella australiborealis TaxID=1544696 RepID=UPI001F4ECEE3|nr:TerC family protein [Rosenbergiella australiborealis]
MQTVGTPLLWGIFSVIVITMIIIDLKLKSTGRTGSMGVKQAAIWSLIWVCVSLAFATGLWFYLRHLSGSALASAQTLNFLTGYLLEKALAVDNVFVWLMLFSAFAIPPALQQRVLIYGVLGAIVLRTIMIFAGSWLVNEFSWILYIFGAFLVITGIKMFMSKSDHDNPEDGRLLQGIKKRLRVTEQLEGERFFVVRQGIRYATPLLLALIMVELSDVIFAVDSIPAIFAVTTDPFIVLTSNLFAILGLRAMYFLLAGVAEKFSLLQYGLAVILTFIGVKMLLIDVWHIPTTISLSVIAVILISTLAINHWLNIRKKI